MAIGTGHGATVTFNSGAIANVIDVTGSERTLPVVDQTVLGTSNARAKAAGDLQDIGTTTVRLFEDGEAALLDLDGTTASLVLTYKQQASEATSPADYTGNAFIVRRKDRDHQTNEMGIVEYDFQWTGKPTRTAAT